jgi:hypothetical protein
MVFLAQPKPDVQIVKHVNTVKLVIVTNNIMVEDHFNYLGIIIIRISHNITKKIILCMIILIKYLVILLFVGHQQFGFG